jgi:Terminase large subunit, T4likevirus-type, N-terminal
MAAQDSARARQDLAITWEAQPKQSAFISCPCDDVGFGGARGGGKSDAVIGDFISHEDYYGADAIALAFRRERTQLVELMERARVIMLPLGFRWHEQDKYFRGPKGGRLRFAYLESDADADAYQGHSYTRIYPEEMGTFPREAPINKMQATLRSGAGVPCRMKGTMNPGGVGHNWVKERYKLAQYPRGYQVFRTEFVNPYTGRAVQKTRVFIPSHLGDNRFLGDEYAAQLFQVGSQELVRAWLEGDWSIVSGSYFPEWSAARHVVEPFPIPDEWARFRSGDWGSARPFSIGWWAVASDDHPLRDGRVIPRGALVRYREWYGSNGHPDVGLRLTAEEVGRGIAEREANEPRHPVPGVLDPRCFANDGGPSIAERFYECYAENGKLVAKKGPGFRPADNARVARAGAMGGWDQVRARLIGTASRHPETQEILWSTGCPMIYFFSTCRDSIRTIPALPHDLARPEDVDTEAEDHAADEVRYACMSRPYVRKEKVSEVMKILSTHQDQCNVTLNDLWDAHEKRGKRLATGGRIR